MPTLVNYDKWKLDYVSDYCLMMITRLPRLVPQPSLVFCGTTIGLFWGTLCFGNDDLQSSSFSTYISRVPVAFGRKSPTHYLLYYQGGIIFSLRGNLRDLPDILPDIVKIKDYDLGQK